MRADRSDSAEFFRQVCRGNGVWENISNTVCKVFAGALSDFTIMICPAETGRLRESKRFHWVM